MTSTKTYHKCGGHNRACHVTGFCEFLGYAHCRSYCREWCKEFVRTWKPGRNREVVFRQERGSR